MRQSAFPASSAFVRSNRTFFPVVPPPPPVPPPFAAPGVAAWTLKSTLFAFVSAPSGTRARALPAPVVGAELPSPLLLVGEPYATASMIVVLFSRRRLPAPLFRSAPAFTSVRLVTVVSCATTKYPLAGIVPDSVIVRYCVPAVSNAASVYPLRLAPAGPFSSMNVPTSVLGES